MAKNSFRVAVVLASLLGTLALVVPLASRMVDAWLLSAAPEPIPAHQPLRPANPTLLPTGQQLSHETTENRRAEPLAFGYDEESPSPDFAELRPVDHIAPAAELPADGGELATLQREIEDLGAASLTVERDGDRFECRTLIPLTPQSTYQKAFNAYGTTPQAAIKQVLAEVRIWQREMQRR